jgi:hypothetical protein
MAREELRRSSTPSYGGEREPGTAGIAVRAGLPHPQHGGGMVVEAEFAARAHVLSGSPSGMLQSGFTPPGASTSSTSRHEAVTVGSR